MCHLSVRLRQRRKRLLLLLMCCGWRLLCLLLRRRHHRRSLSRRLRQLLVQMAHGVHLIHLVHLMHLVHVVELIDLVDLLHRRGVVHAALNGSRSRLSSDMMLLIPTTRVRIAVDARMAGQLVGSAKAFCAAREATSVRLLACVCADVSCLMLETMKGLVAQRTFVWSR